MIKFFQGKMWLVASLLCLITLAGCSGSTRLLPTSGTIRADSNWEYANELKAHGRYELAREYYLFALAEAKTYEEQQWLERELYTIDLLIESRR